MFFESLKAKLSHPVVVIAIIAAVSASVVFAIKQNGDSPYLTQKVTRDNLVQTVVASGMVQPAEEVDLAFEITGRVSRVPVDIGDTVSAGQILAELNRSDDLAKRAKAAAGLQSAQAQLLQYEAALDVARAELDALQRGSLDVELDVKRAQLEAAEQSLQNTYNSVRSLLLEKYYLADDAVRKQTDEMFSNDTTNSPDLAFVSTNFQAEINAESLRRTSELALLDWLPQVTALSSSAAGQEVTIALDDSLANLEVVRNFLDELFKAVDGAIGITQTTINTYKTNINTGRTNVGASITAVSDKQQDILSKQISITTAESELKLLEAGSTEEVIAAQSARVRQAEASLKQQQATILQYQADLQSADVNLAKNLIKAPISGVVTRQDAKVGQIVAANQNVVSLISDAEYEIIVDISEVDIAKFKIGDSAQVTLDAFGHDIYFAATVVSIEPAERIIAGIPTYRTKLIFTSDTENLFPGLTANVEIQSVIAENVLLVPKRAVTQEKGKSFVQVYMEGKPGRIEIREIEEGRSDSAGNIEVITGLNGTETIIIAEK